MTITGRLTLMAGSGLLLVLLPLAAVLYMRKKRFKQLGPAVDRYEEVGRVQQLFVYPIKGCEGVPVDVLVATTGGLCTPDRVFDRSFCVVDSKRKVLNSIRCRAIGGVHIRIIGKPHQSTDDPSIQAWLKLSYPLEPEAGTMMVPVYATPPSDSRLLKGAFMNDEFEGIDCGDQVAEWFAHVLQTPDARLVQHASSKKYRAANSVGKKSAAFEQQFQIMYQNYSDLHLITKPSVIALNKQVRLRQATSASDMDGDRKPPVEVDGRNFRPNVIVDETAGAWVEDQWSFVRIGDCVLQQIQNCFRCANTTVSNVIETESQRKRLVGTSEPLQTLRTFRRSTDRAEDQRVKGSPFFGCLMGTRRSGQFSVGDSVWAVISPNSI